MGEFIDNEGRPSDRDPTYGRIDADIQRAVAEMGPASIGERVAAENNLQRLRGERVESAVMPPGTFLVGALGHGARIYEPVPPWWRRLLAWLRRG